LCRIASHATPLDPIPTRDLCQKLAETGGSHPTVLLQLVQDSVLRHIIAKPLNSSIQFTNYEYLFQLKLRLYGMLKPSTECSALLKWTISGDILGGIAMDLSDFDSTLLHVGPI
jgi:hypothetical protein